MKKTSMARYFYSVEFCLVVDRPDLRDSSYMPVEPGKRMWVRWDYATYNGAVGEFERILAGEYDFGSEYVAWAYVVRRDALASSYARPATVRRRVDRSPARKAGPVNYSAPAVAA